MEDIVAPLKAPNDQNAHERKLIAIVDELAGELRPQHVRQASVSSSSWLERDLGIDSLGRAELILRLERAFGVRLPINLIAEADTVGDLQRALDQAGQWGTRIVIPSISPPLTTISAATEANTLLEVLEWHVAQHPERVHVTVLEDEATIVGKMTYGELSTASRAIAAGLIERDIMPGDRVALMLPTGVEFFASFFGILYAGAVPVPIYPPMQRSQIEDYARRQAGILSNAGARMLITLPEGLKLGSLLKGLVETLSSVESAASLSAHSTEIALPSLQSGFCDRAYSVHVGEHRRPKGCRPQSRQSTCQHPLHRPRCRPEFR